MNATLEDCSTVASDLANSVLPHARIMQLVVDVGVYCFPDGVKC